MPLIFFRKKKAPVKCFYQEFRQEALSGPIDLGVRTVDVDRIVGSVGRCMDFPLGFKRKKSLLSISDSRMESIKKAMVEGRGLPIIELYKVRDDYYVLDGHHRVVAARELGQRHIDAHVVEYLPLDKNRSDALYRERAFFEMKTKLEDVTLSENGSYNLLMREIEEYQKNLQAGQERISPEDAARRWYYEIYQPSVREIEDSGILQFFTDLTPGDLYACLHWHQRLRLRKTYPTSPDESLKDLKKLTAELYSLIEEDRNLTSDETIQKLEEIMPPCIYHKFCPRWPMGERPTKPSMLRIGSLFSEASTRLRHILARVF